MYNMMTCAGSGWTYSILGGCSMAWFSLAIIVLLALVLRRQCDDGILAGTGFNIFGAFILGLGANVVLTAITGSARWSLLGGLVGIIVGGWVVGQFIDTGGSSND